MESSQFFCEFSSFTVLLPFTTSMGGPMAGAPTCIFSCG